MPKKRIFTIGRNLPGDDFEYIQFNSDQSLLDADIILYQVGFGGNYASETYSGEPLFNRSDSVQIHQNVQHWHSELIEATNTGKLVIIYLAKPLKCYRYTGDQQFSGTGRSRVTTNIVNPINSYSCIPVITSTEAKTGKEIKLTKDGSFLASYWKDFSNISPYETIIDGKFSEILLTTKSGNKTVGAIFRSKGVLLFLPPLSFDEEHFSTKTGNYWNKQGIAFGKKVCSSIIGLYTYLIEKQLNSPPPTWVLDSAYLTPEESVLQKQISKAINKISEIEKETISLQQKLDQAGSIKALLYEQGKPLEEAIRQSLITLGFKVHHVSDSNPEFDAIFESVEGRALGEVEGKDNKSINIDKISQLERNLQEDFAREETKEYAKGVLFGNGQRLLPLSERKDLFTEKCIMAAKRAHIALVRTFDLFGPIVYLRNNNDTIYARSCREAIFKADGEIVVFPPPPTVSKGPERSQEIK